MHDAPTRIEFHNKSQKLDIHFSNKRFEFSSEFLRVHSPSAEVKGHGPGQEVLQFGKQNVRIENIEPNGHYAIRILFDDGHDTGIFSWQYLNELGENHDEKWQSYLSKLDDAGKGRDPDTQIIRLL